MEGAAAAVRRGQRCELSGLTPGAQVLATVLLHRRAQQRVVLVVPDNDSAEEWRDGLESFQELTRSTAEDPPLVLPAIEIDPYEGLSTHDEILERRAQALWKATRGLPLLVVPALALATRLAPPASYRNLARTLRRGDFLDLEGLTEYLNLVGYRRSDPVEQPGQYSVRGGLLDVFSPESARPVRVELFGDEIESLREFDPETQRSARQITEATLLALTPLPPTPERIARLSGEAGDQLALAPGWEFRIPGLEGFVHSVLDLAPEAAVVVAEPALVQAELERWWQRLQDRYLAALRKTDAGADVSDIPAPESIFFAPQDVEAQIAGRPGLDLRELRLEELDLSAETLELRARSLESSRVPAPSDPLDTPIPGVPPPSRPRVQTAWASRPAPRFHGAVARLMEDVRNALQQGGRMIFVAANMGEVERLSDLFTEYNIPFQLGVRPQHGDAFLAEKSYFSTEEPRNIIVRGNLARGFLLPAEQVTFYASADVFETAGLPRQPGGPPRSGSQISTFLSDFRDLALGDYVVHVEHGIGKYAGLKKIDAEPLPVGSRHLPPATPESGEFMVLEYAEQAKLYVPLTRMDLVQKYRAAEGPPVALDRLGGTQWQTRKTKVKKAMKDMADELMKLYADRKAVRVAPCAPDSHWHQEFADTFPFTETADQARAIVDTRADLEGTVPMDRLLVGDVGYGKTEVAMRAAFKVVMEQRQVAILAPTTVLAFQHFQTFKRRFAAFPISIDMLSGFRSSAEQKEVVARLVSGRLDIVIGTHRLLSKDIVFQNLGLLVVDEEQRFGVRHKERLKQLKKEVHVLAMSATPIPRTLNMSLVGLRDMSVIETPPKDRLAIQTVVAPWNENLIRAAIENEMTRGGQVYFVHNRVETIWEIAGLIQKLVPAARIAVGHGQMGGAAGRARRKGTAAANGTASGEGEVELERVMLRFMRNEADVLVATTIIENGLDIPLANTIIVNRADRLGLSELYQLRGRVGRSNRRAYAYLLVPSESELTPIARKRLAAMREFSDLGAGFKIAALDLELRGAGNLMGGEQSGHIEAVGFDLYVHMLERAVRELKGQPVEADIETLIQLGLDIRIPHEYIAEENQRLRMYKRLAEAEDDHARQDVLQELADRYGPPPAAVQNLLEYAGLKTSCRRSGVKSLERRGEVLSVRFMDEAPVDPQRLAALVRATPNAQFTPGGVLRLPLAARTATQVFDGVRRVLEAFDPRAVTQG